MHPRTTSGTLAALQSRRSEILRIASEYGASNVHVFGSVARGEDDEKSDVDLLIDMSIGDDEGGFAYFGRLEDLRRELTALLGREVQILVRAALEQVTPPSARRDRMRARVLADAVAL